MRKCTTAVAVGPTVATDIEYPHSIALSMPTHRDGAGRPTPVK